MKKATYFILAVLILLAAGTPSAEAHMRGRIWIGPVWGPWWGPPYYPSPPVVIQQQPPVYEEQTPQQQEQPYYWYYCPDSKTYYPYVKQCPGGWLKVVPTPAPPNARGKE